MNKFNNILELNNAAKSVLEGNFSEVCIEAEISRFVNQSSGHWYFTLKDSSGSINATMFRGQNARVNFIPKDGMKVECVGKVTLYAQDGRYQINVVSMKEAGSGDIDAAFRALCEKLIAQGICQRNINGSLRKNGAKPFPRLPKRVGIVTSLSSAAFADMNNRINACGYFLCDFICFDTLVQGKDAPESIKNALLKADNAGLDAIILARGGGSKEDLWCFNDESLALCIAGLKTPIISAVGHEIDYSISDFVADHRSITPTAAIEDLMPTRDALSQFIDMQFNKISIACNNSLQKAQNRLKIANTALSPVALSARLDKIALKINNKQNAIKASLEHRISLFASKIEKLEIALKARREVIEIKRSSVEIFSNDEKISLDTLKIGDKITLKSAYSSKDAQITN